MFNRYIKSFDAAIQAAKVSAPPRKSGSGIVILGGGKYDASTYVNIRMIRETGYKGPVILYHKVLDPVHEAIRALDIDVRELDGLHPPFPGRNTWEWKEVAISDCGFEHVLYLDADTYPVQNLEGVFQSPEYRRTGCLFWRDVADSEGFFNPALWGIKSRETGFTPQGGTILVNTVTHHAALKVLRHLHTQSNYWYSMAYSDQELLRAIWVKMNRPFGFYSLDRVDKIANGSVFVHRDPSGHPLIIHLTGAKFGVNPAPSGEVPGYSLAKEHYHEFSRLVKL